MNEQQLLDIIQNLTQQLEAKDRRISELEAQNVKITKQNERLKKRVDKFKAESKKQAKTDTTKVPKVPTPPKPQNTVPRPVKPQIPEFSGPMGELLKSIAKFVGKGGEATKIINSDLWSEIAEYTNTSGWYDRLVDCYNAYLATTYIGKPDPEVIYKVDEVWSYYYEEIYDNFLYSQKKLTKKEVKKYSK